ncbi:protease complex subunit PrcB family protein [Pseudomonadales bacterium]|nr:protease complex subunit PrcB family protein [Pseudomonadales bacterium]
MGAAEMVVEAKWTGWNSITERANLVIKSREEWEEIWNGVSGVYLPQPETPEVDFDKNMIIAVFMGAKPNSCYSSLIAGIFKEEERIVVQVLEGHPGPSCICFSVITSPYHIVAVKKSETPVEFATSVARFSCRNPGEISVGFYDDVTEDEANALVESYGLTWEPHFPKMFSFWISGALDIEALETSDIVHWVKHRSQPDGYGNLLVQFNTKATKESARELINSLDPHGYVEITSVNEAPKRGIINVPLGQELKWIETFKKEQIIRYAELN